MFVQDQGFVIQLLMDQLNLQKEHAADLWQFRGTEMQLEGFFRRGFTTGVLAILGDRPTGYERFPIVVGGTLFCSDTAMGGGGFF